MVRELMICGVIAAAMSGCADNRAPLSHDFGNAVRHNMMVQTITPSPDYVDREVPSMSGARASGAVKRYENSEVVTPETVPTTQMSGGKGK